MKFLSGPVFGSSAHVVVLNCVSYVERLSFEGNKEVARRQNTLMSYGKTSHTKAQ